MTAIEWTDETWNPVVGCSPVSEGCRHCYAARMAHRLAHNPLTGTQYKGLVDHESRWEGVARVLRKRFDQPLRWRKPRRVFVCSMGDLFHDQVSAHAIAGVFGVMACAERHTFQVLTKRPERMLSWQLWLSGKAFQQQSIYPEDRHSWRMRRLLWAAGHDFAPFKISHGIDLEWPIPNVWLGASVESAKHLVRIDDLRCCDAAVRFLSCEPLLGPLGSLDLTGIHWVSVGGETGPGARPMHPAWAREIRDQCIADGVPFFFKQWGAWSATSEERQRGTTTGVTWARPDGTWGCPTDESARYEDIMARIGKKRAGRHLDGRLWEEMPT